MNSGQQTATVQAPKGGELGDYMVSIASTGVARMSIIKLTREDAYQTQRELVDLLKHNGWTVDARYQSLYKVSYQGSETLYISVTDASVIWDAMKPPQHWLTRVPEAVANV